MFLIEIELDEELEEKFGGFNPLNQVYVFNAIAHNIFYCKELQPHFRRGHLCLLQFRAFLLQKV